MPKKPGNIFRLFGKIRLDTVLPAASVRYIDIGAAADSGTGRTSATYGTFDTSCGTKRLTTNSIGTDVVNVSGRSA